MSRPRLPHHSRSLPLAETVRLIPPIHSTEGSWRLSSPFSTFSATRSRRREPPGLPLLVSCVNDLRRGGFTRGRAASDEGDSEEDAVGGKWEDSSEGEVRNVEDEDHVASGVNSTDGRTGTGFEVDMLEQCARYQGGAYLPTNRDMLTSTGKKGRRLPVGDNRVY